MQPRFSVTPVDDAPPLGATPGLQVDNLREELARFRHQLDQVPQDYLSMSAIERHAAYAHLTQAAVQATQIAETAVRSLDELARSTQRDPLTETPNRALMQDRLENAVTMARRRDSRMAVMFLDLDHFKHVNDTQGHACGDEVLKLVARRLEEVVRDSDTVCRYGGDEFVVLLTEISQATDAGVIAEKMLERLGQPHPVGDPDEGVRASIGISLYPDDGTDVSTLLERADAAMYRAKKSPGSCYRFHAEIGGADSGPEVPQGPGNEVLSADSHQAMRQANERLVLSVLAREPVDAETEAMHGRRVRFLAMVAHELRHPLAPIRTAAELIRRASGDEGLLERMHSVIENQVTHMARLVDDLLVDSRVATGRFRMHPAPVNLREVLQRVSDTWQPAIAMKRQQFALRMPASPLWVLGDADRLAQVLVNLLDNASKFTPEGGRIRLLAATAGDCVAVRVSDSGMGLPADQHDCIFELFARGTHAMALHKGGLGIGLAVARELIEAHEGSISVHSRGEGLGCRFDLRLPVLAAGTLRG